MACDVQAVYGALGRVPGLVWFDQKVEIRNCRAAMRTIRRYVIATALSLVAAAGCSEDSTNDPLPTALQIATSRAPVALEGRAYVLDIVAQGGVAPYRFELSGAPSGLSIDSASGVVSGTPTEVGAFSLMVLVTDGAMTQAEVTIPFEVVASDGRAPLAEFDGTCEMPTILQPVAGLATLEGRMPSTTESSVLCGGGDRATAYFRVTLRRRSSVRIAITTSDRDVVLGRAFEGCPPIRIFDDFCARVLSETLPAGDHVFRLFGPPGVEVAMTVEVQALASTGVPTCSEPEVVDLSAGAVTVMGNWNDALDENGPMTCGAAAPASEVVYEVELSEPSDLSVQVNPGVRTYIRTDDCDTGAEVLCDQGFGERRIPNAAAGTYYLFLEPVNGTSYQATIEATPPTPPAANFSCATAEMLDLTNGSASVRGDFSNVPTFDSGLMCGDDEVGLYYAFQLNAPATVTLPSVPAGVQTALLSGDCAALTDLTCVGTGDNGLCSPNLPAGDYVLRLAPFGFQMPSFDLTATVMNTRPVPMNTTCATAEVITSTPAMVQGSTRDATNALSLGQCGSDNAGELFYRLDLGVRSDVFLSMIGGNTRFNYAVYTGECNSLQQVECGAAFSDLTAQSVPAGPVTIVVEPNTTFNNPYACADELQQAFILEIGTASLANAPPNDTCASPTVVTFPRGLGSAEVVSGTTRGATNSHDSVVCPFGVGTSTITTPGPDVVYALDVPVAGRLRVAVVGADTNTRVALLTACDGTGGGLVCDSFGNALETEAPIAAGRYYVRVDHGLGSQPTDFVVVATLLP